MKRYSYSWITRLFRKIIHDDIGWNRCVVDIFSGRQQQQQQHHHYQLIHIGNKTHKLIVVICTQTTEGSGGISATATAQRLLNVKNT